MLTPLPSVGGGLGRGGADRLAAQDVQPAHVHAFADAVAVDAHLRAGRDARGRVEVQAHLAPVGRSHGVPRFGVPVVEVRHVGDELAREGGGVGRAALVGFGGAAKTHHDQREGRGPRAGTAARQGGHHVYTCPETSRTDRPFRIIFRSTEARSPNQSEIRA
jgi:hypothetical protein